MRGLTMGWFRKFASMSVGEYLGDHGDLPKDFGEIGRAR